MQLRNKLRNVSKTAVSVPGVGTMAPGAIAMAPTWREADEPLLAHVEALVAHGVLELVGDAVLLAEALSVLGLRADATAWLAGAFRLVVFKEGRRTTVHHGTRYVEPVALGAELESGLANQWRPELVTARTLPAAISVRIIFVDLDGVRERTGTREVCEARSQLRDVVALGDELELAYLPLYTLDTWSPGVIVRKTMLFRGDGGTAMRWQVQR